MKVHLCAVALLGCGIMTAQRAITNDDIVKMSEAGVAQDLIVKTIAESPVRFDLSPDCLIGFKKAAVPDDIVRAMMARNREVQSSVKDPEPSPVAAHPAVKSDMDRATQQQLTPPVIAQTPAAASSADREASPNGPVSPASNLKPASASPEATPHFDTGYEWILQPGRPEVGVTVGISSGPDWVNKGALSGTADAAVGIFSYLAGFGSYGYDRLDATAHIQELFGGFRISLPARLSPYAEAFGGAVRLTESTSGFHASVNETAFGGGGGFNVAFTNRFGMRVNARIIKAHDLRWYGQATTGIYSRF